MGYEGQDFSEIAGGVSPAFVETLYKRFRESPDSIEPSWRGWFEGLEAGPSGASWANPAWPPTTTDDLTAALDPTQMEPAAKPAKAAAPAAAAPAPSQDALIAAAADSIRAMMLIRTYRVRGHLAANLDPLGLARQDLPEDLKTEYHGFSDADIDRPVYLGGQMGLQWATIRELVDILRANYCGNVGLEYMHIADVEERRFLQDRMEGKDKAIRLHYRRQEGDPDQGDRRRAVGALPRQEICRHQAVRARRRRGDDPRARKRDQIWRPDGRQRDRLWHGASRAAQRARQCSWPSRMRVIFHEFGGGSANPEDVGGSGDVKYHLGTSTDREFDGIKVHMSLVANPSHLEAADPVVLGKVRAIQTLADDLDDQAQASLPVLIHGDAAFAGQGIVWECLGFSGIRGYNTGGCLHFIINNQIGFTTSPQFARSSPYPSDVAKGVQAPIFHVNGDDPEAVTFACKMAIELPPALPPRHRDRHVVLSPLRP